MSCSVPRFSAKSGMEHERVLFTPFHRAWCAKKTKLLGARHFSMFFREHPKKSIPDWNEYCQVIKNPMWFREVSDRIRNNAYVYVHEWTTDMLTICENALTYNGAGTHGFECATILKRDFEKECLPVPDSERMVKLIELTHRWRKIDRILQEPPQAVEDLVWSIPKIREVEDASIEVTEWKTIGEGDFGEAWKAKIGEAE